MMDGLVKNHLQWMEKELQELRHENYKIDKAKRDSEAEVEKLKKENEELRLRVKVLETKFETRSS